VVAVNWVVLLVAHWQGMNYGFGSASSVEYSGFTGY
jgi:hypothetical protein